MSMVKNRIRPVKQTKARMSYARQEEVLEMPNLIEVQRLSSMVPEEGLKVFDYISPITDYSGNLSLEFVDFKLCEEDIKYSTDECRKGYNLCRTY